MDRPQLLDSVIRWLRAGYPHGVPSGDYIPLVAILRRQLSDDEVREIATTLAGGPEVNRIDAGVEINKVTDELPSDGDLDRVRSVLVGAGWPFDDDPMRRGPHRADPDPGDPDRRGPTD